MLGVLMSGPPGIRTLYLDPRNELDAPVLAARVVNRANPSQAADLPVLRYAAIEALNPTVLAFPSARRTADSHTNLTIAEVSKEAGAALTLLIEVFSPTGERLGSGTFDVSSTGGFSSSSTLFLPDVLSTLGITQLQDGQIRVTKTGGTGLMWGLLATVYDEGRLSVSVGMNP
jgi:hypothetical protein